MRGVHIRFIGLGMLLGYSLSRIGFADFGEVHRMFTFSDLRLFLTFVAGVVASALGYLAFHKLTEGWPKKRFHPGTIPGGILFGVGWAVSGACPAIVLVQLGEGRILAVTTLLAIIFGNWLYGQIHRRFFRWETGSCGL